MNNQPVKLNPVFEDLSNPDTFINHFAELKQQAEDIKEHKGLFIVKPANKWIEESKIRPIPKMLFSEFWFESELCILFADTNLGKSALAVQIANSISEGERIPGFKLEAEKQQVLYFDFELSDKQFENRYSNDYSNHYIFDKNFFRIEINPEADIPGGQTFEEYLNDSLEQSIKETKAKILIIDNITYLRSETEKAKDALPLMKGLKALNRKYGLSILVLAHTPKRDLSKPITKNDLQGSKMIINFCDSAFTIGESQKDNGLRYLKQIKSRSTEVFYNSGNVCLIQLNKNHNFLKFDWVEYSTEDVHLKHFTDKDREQLINDVKELSKQNKSQRQISEKLGIGLGTVNKYLKK